MLQVVRQGSELDGTPGEERTMKQPTSRTILVLTLLGLATLAFAPAATADRFYHSQHIPLEPVGDSPLRSGFVENIHANGPNVYGHEIYHLSGAAPNTIYQVTLLLFPFDPSCSAAPVAVPTAQLRTNGAGNGNANFFFRPSDVPPEIRNATHGIRWTVASAGSAYETSCSAVTLD
jgi:hypothetical protein